MDAGWAALIVAVIWGAIAAVLYSMAKKNAEHVRGLKQTNDSVQRIPDALKPHPEGSHPMSTDPDQIRREIEATRNSLSSDVDALAYKVSPGRIVDDRKQRARNALQNVRDKVMGTASDLGHGTSHGRPLGGRPRLVGGLQPSATARTRRPRPSATPRSGRRR